MTKARLAMVIVLFVAVLSGIRIAWLQFKSPPDSPAAIRGVLDLRDYDGIANRSITLHGEWSFETAGPEEKDFGALDNRHSKLGFIQMPEKAGNREFGTYRLKILLNELSDRTYGLRIPYLSSDFEVYVNGQLLAQKGINGRDESVRKGEAPFNVFFRSETGEWNVEIRTVSADPFHSPGIAQSIRFGDEHTVERERDFFVGLQELFVVILLIHMIYACILYLIGSRRKVLVLFLLLIGFGVFSVLTADDMLLMVWLPINAEWAFKLEELAYLNLAVFLLEFVKGLLPQYASVRPFRWYFFFGLILSLYILAAPAEWIEPLLPLTMLMLLIPFLALPWLTLRNARNGGSGSLFLVFGSFAFANHMIWSAIYNSGWLDMGFYPVDLLTGFFLLASYWFWIFIENAKRTESLAAELRKADKMKDDFLANTSHELRTPLHGMLNIAENVLGGGRDSLGDKNVRDLELLVTVGRRMTFLLNDLLDLTRLKESVIRLHMSRVQLQGPVSGVLDMLRYVTEGKPVRLLNGIPADFPAVRADENRLVQILFNLVHNALKYTQEGKVSIHAAVREGQAVIWVADTGIGMDEETQRKIFQPYAQGDGDGGGLGLGLSICRQLVELHGGTLIVTAAPGKGSEFAFTLPLADVSSDTGEDAFIRETAAYEEVASSAEDLPVNAIAPAQDAESGRLSVLAVDDDPLNLKILTAILVPEAYDVVTAGSGEEALTLLDAREWDLIVADVMMPRMSGYELTRVIRERFQISELPILLLTARSRPEDIDAGFRAGANDYVTKPMDAKELKTRVRALTKLKQSVSERLRLEAAWLQAQIQPHFLYNTMNSIAALSDIDARKMRDLLEHFGNYLQRSFDFRNLERLIPLEHELSLVRSYLYIEEARFGSRLQVEWQVDEGIGLMLPPLSIQTLVENAVRHGLMKRSKGGRIRIRILDLGNQAEISIEDDGVGMDEETQARWMDSRPEVRSGIGLKNTERRLRQIYGRGLNIESARNRGTKISFIAWKSRE